MKTRKQTNLIVAIAMIFTLFGACKKSADVPNVYPPAPTVVTGVKLTATTKFGNVLTDNNGLSLYFFSKDVPAATSNCNGTCVVTWPVFYKENPTIGTGLAASDFSVITRADGSRQTAYKGWPLYYNVNDTKAGDTNGDAVNNVWAIAKADYTVMFANAQLVGLDNLQYNDQSALGTVVSQYITDPNGRTLYLYTKDLSSQNTFTKPDFSNDSNWPIYTVSTIVSIPTVLDKTQFTIITVSGRTQLVYKGHPMYFFGQDNALRGNTKGVAFPQTSAAVWKVLNSTTPAL